LTIVVRRTGGTTKTPFDAAGGAVGIPQSSPATPKNGTTTAVYQSTRSCGSDVLWSAAACCRFHSGQLAGRAQERGTRNGEARASSPDQSGSKLPHSRAPAAHLIWRLFSW